MIKYIIKIINNILKLFEKYPVDPSVLKIKNFLDSIKRNTKKDAKVYKVAMEGTHDPLFFCLLGSIIKDMRLKASLKVFLIDVNSINNSVGSGLRSVIMRSFPVGWMISSQWIRLNKGVADVVAFRSVSYTGLIDEIKRWSHANRIWRDLKLSNNIESLQINNIMIGDLVIDTYLRFKPSPSFDASDPFVKSILRQSMRDIVKLNRLFSNHDIKLYLTSYTTYVQHGIPCRVAMHYGVPVRSYGNPQTFGNQISNEHPYHSVSGNMFSKNFERLDDKTEKFKISENALNLRLSGEVDTATFYMKESAYKVRQIELPNVKNAVVVFLHDFYDSPHVYGKMIFLDFWQWVIFTINILTVTKVKFFIKPHPNQIDLSAKVFAQLISIYPNLEIISSKITNKQLADGGISCGVTVYGTVAHELAFLGVPSICCANHPHHEFDFCYTARTKEEYKNLLIGAVDIKNCKSKMYEQSLAFFYMHNLHGSIEEIKFRKNLINFFVIFNQGRSDCQLVIDRLEILRRMDCWKNHIDALISQIIIDN